MNLVVVDRMGIVLVVGDGHTVEELIEVRVLLVWLRWEPEPLMFDLLIFSLTLEN